jgi:hypothetical protein
MNLDNTEYIQSYKNSFAIVAGGTFFIIIVLFFTMYSYLKITGVFPKRATNVTLQTKK